MPGLFAAWWAAWLISGFLSNAELRVSFSAETFEELSDAALVAMGANSLAVVAGILAVLVVRRAMERQEARAARLAREAGADADESGAPVAGSD